MSRDYWIVRMTIDSKDDDWKVAVKNNFISIGWAWVDPTHFSLDKKEELIEKLKSIYEKQEDGTYIIRNYYSDGSDKVDTEGHFHNIASQILTFVDNIELESVITLPTYANGGKLSGFYMGFVDSGPYFSENPSDGLRENYKCRRDVKWIRHVTISDASQPLRNTLCGHQTVFLNKHGSEMEAFLNNKKLETNPVVIKTKMDMIGKLHEIQKRLMELSPSDFERMVCETLSLKYDVKAVKTRDVADGGIDFVCIDSLGNTVYRGQVKRVSSSIGNKEILQLRGTLHDNQEGVFVTTTYFTSSAIEEADSHGKKKVHLIDGRLLSQTILDVYENLDEKFKNILKIEK